MGGFFVCLSVGIQFPLHPSADSHAPANTDSDQVLAKRAEFLLRALDWPVRRFDRPLGSRSNRSVHPFEFRPENKATFGLEYWILVPRDR
jgi:hypothetical protein